MVQFVYWFLDMKEKGESVHLFLVHIIDYIQLVLSILPYEYVKQNARPV